MVCDRQTPLNPSENSIGWMFKHQPRRTRRL
jgi:hypothetical protein